MKLYIPKPIDTNNIKLSNMLLSLADKLAKNVHEVWAIKRMNEGWSFGKERNDLKKEHPCLVPYEELTEKEKEYDRATSLETVKLILKLGYKISK